MNFITKYFIENKLKETFCFLKEVPNSWKGSLVGENRRFYIYDLFDDKKLYVLKDGIESENPDYWNIFRHIRDIDCIRIPGNLLLHRDTKKMLGYVQIEYNFRLNAKLSLLKDLSRKQKIVLLLDIQHLMDSLFSQDIVIEDFSLSDFEITTSNESCQFTALDKLAVATEETKKQAMLRMIKNAYCFLTGNEIDVLMKPQRDKTDMWMSALLYDAFQMSILEEKEVDFEQALKEQIKYLTNTCPIHGEYDSRYEECPQCFPSYQIANIQEDYQLVKSDGNINFYQKKESSDKQLYCIFKELHNVQKYRERICYFLKNEEMLQNLFERNIEGFLVRKEDYQVIGYLLSDTVVQATKKSSVFEVLKELSCHGTNKQVILLHFQELRKKVFSLLQEGITIKKGVFSLQNLFCKEDSFEHVEMFSHMDFDFIAFKKQEKELRKEYLNLVFAFFESLIGKDADMTTVCWRKDGLLFGISPAFLLQFEKYVAKEPLDYEIALPAVESLYQDWDELKQFAQSYVLSPMDFPIIFEEEITSKENHFKTGPNDIVVDGKEMTVYVTRYNGGGYLESFANILKCYQEQISKDNLKLPTALLYKKKVDTSDNKRHLLFIGYLVPKITSKPLCEASVTCNDGKEILTIIKNVMDVFPKKIPCYESMFYDENNQIITYIPVSYQEDQGKEIVDFVFDFLSENKKSFFEDDYVLLSALLEQIYKEKSQHLHVLQRLKQCIQNLLSSWDSYCTEHQIYYSSTYGACPKCYPESVFIDFENKDGMEYPYWIEENSPIGNTCIKVVQPDTITQEKQKLLLKLFKLSEEYVFMPQKFVRRKDTKDLVGLLYKKVKTKSLELLDNKEKLSLFIHFLTTYMNLYYKKSMLVTETSFENLLYIPGTHEVYIPDIEEVVNVSPKRKKEIHQNDAKLYLLVKEALLKDETLGIEEEQIKNLEEVYSTASSRLEALVKCMNAVCAKLTYYCKEHHLWSKSVWCPICQPEMKNVQQASLIEAIQEIQDVNDDRNMKTGGEAKVVINEKTKEVTKYFLIDEKLYREEGKIKFLINIEKKQKILSKLIGLDSFKNLIEQGYAFDFSIPTSLLYDEHYNIIFAFVMKSMPGNILFKLKNKSFKKKEQIDIKKCLKICLSLGYGIEYAHMLGATIGDLNDKNILVDGEHLHFLDVDSYSLGEDKLSVFVLENADPLKVIPVRDTLGNYQLDETGAIKYEASLGKDTDWYAYAIQVFYILTNVHPFGGTYLHDDTLRRQENIHPEARIKEDKKILRMRAKVSMIGHPNDFSCPLALEAWDWMSPELVEAFIDIFERGKRESIVSILEKEYERIAGSKYPFRKVEMAPIVDNQVTEEVVEPKENSVMIKEELPEEKVEMTSLEESAVHADKEAIDGIIEKYKEAKEVIILRQGNVLKNLTENFYVNLDGNLILSKDGEEEEWGPFYGTNATFFLQSNQLDVLYLLDEHNSLFGLSKEQGMKKIADNVLPGSYCIGNNQIAFATSSNKVYHYSFKKSSITNEFNIPAQILGVNFEAKSRILIATVEDSQSSHITFYVYKIRGGSVGTTTIKTSISAKKNFWMYGDETSKTWLVIVEGEQKVYLLNSKEIKEQTIPDAVQLDPNYVNYYALTIFYPISERIISYSLNPSPGITKSISFAYPEVNEKSKLRIINNGFIVRNDFEMSKFTV